MSHIRVRNVNPFNIGIETALGIYKHDPVIRGLADNLLGAFADRKDERVVRFAVCHALNDYLAGNLPGLVKTLKEGLPSLSRPDEKVKL